MSVIKAKRDENPLEVLTLARNLTAYTLQATNNEKHFPKRSRWQLAGTINQAALQIYCLIRRANRVRVVSLEDYERRMRLQKQAIEEIDTLLGLIDIAGERYQLPGSTQHHWAGLCENLDGKARAWHRANKKDLLPEGTPPGADAPQPL